MKKILSVLLVTMMVLSCFSVVSFAEESYDNVWTMYTDKESYNAGDYLVLTIKNGVEISQFNGASIHFTFDENVLEYVTDYDEVYDEFEEEPETLPGVTSYGTSSGGELTTDGEFMDTVGAAGSKIRANRVVYTVYFKVKQNIKGTNELNFRWVLKSTNTPSWVVTTTQTETGDVETYFNVKFVDAKVTVVGEDIPTEEITEFLPYEDTNVFAAKNEFENNTVEINGVKKNIGSRYAVACSKVPARNAAKVEAGFIISNENAKLTLETAREKNIYKAANFAFDNIFTGLFYGPGLEAGKTYFVIPYVTYSDGVTIYASEAKSFTMPE